MKEGTLEILKVLLEEGTELRNKELRKKTWPLVKNKLKIEYDSWKVYVCKILDSLQRQNMVQRTVHGFRDVRYKIKDEEARSRAQELLTLNAPSYQEKFSRILEGIYEMEGYQNRLEAEPKPPIAYVMLLASDFQSLTTLLCLSQAAVALKRSEEETVRLYKAQAETMFAYLWEAAVEFLKKHTSEIQDSHYGLAKIFGPEDREKLSDIFGDLSIDSEEKFMRLLQWKIQKTYELFQKNRA